MSSEKYKKIDNPDYLKIYSSNDILVYHHDKLQNTIYHYYKSGESKSIEYRSNSIFLVHTKKGASISNTSNQNDINQFIEKNYLEINSEDDDNIRAFTFSWIKEIMKSDPKYIIPVLNNLISANETGMKTYAIQFAAIHHISECVETISLELNNTTKTDIYRGPKWDDYETPEIFTVDTFSELAKSAIEMIKTKNNDA
ncbi:hypothetical protein [Dokdonia sp.]|uniref:hypothetical protein n=1 Tax=Dokdonia sp. TaxID=2024995 RepID=UPI003265AFB2